MDYEQSGGVTAGAWKGFEYEYEHDYEHEYEREVMAAPNIILIMADELRWDCLGYAGNPDVRTPNLDALAAHAVNFTQAICQQPLCVPSRMTVLTGRHPREHGVRDNQTPLPDGVPTFPRLLREAGYHTAAIGKMHFVPPRADHGFDLMRIAEQDSDGRYEDDYHAWLAAQGKEDRIDYWDQVERAAAPKTYWLSFGAMRSNLPESLHSSTWIGDQAVRFLSDTAREPFFLSVGFIKPHHPFDPPAPWDRLYEPRALRLPPGFVLPVPEDDARHEAFFDMRQMTEPRFRRVLAHYYATISHIDAQIGRILATLTARGLTNNVMVFTADHGDYMGQHGMILKSGARPYDALLRVPLLIAGLSGQRRGVADPALAELTDLAPTILDIAGAPPLTECSGRGLVPQLFSEGISLRAAAHAEHGRDMRIVRTATHKLIESADPAMRAFYDLAADPYEFDNRYDDATRVDDRDALRRLLHT